jgi:ABC-type Na+ transport system ATPase subunit NatA
MLKTTPFALERNRALARYYATTQSQIAEAAHILFDEHMRGVDVTQVPELQNSVCDLEETVGRLIIQMEHLERLTYELAGFEADRQLGS